MSNKSELVSAQDYAQALLEACEKVGVKKNRVSVSHQANGYWSQVMIKIPEAIITYDGIGYTFLNNRAMVILLNETLPISGNLIEPTRLSNVLTEVYVDPAHPHAGPQGKMCAENCTSQINEMVAKGHFEAAVAAILAAPSTYTPLSGYRELGEVTFCDGCGEEVSEYYMEYTSDDQYLCEECRCACEKCGYSTSYNNLLHIFRPSDTVRFIVEAHDGQRIQVEVHFQYAEGVCFDCVKQYIEIEVDRLATAGLVEFDPLEAYADRNTENDETIVAEW